VKRPWFEARTTHFAMFSCAPKYLESLAQDVNDPYGTQVANTYMVPVKSLLTAGARVGSHGGDLPAAATMTTRQFFGTLRFAPVPPSAPWNDYYSFGHQPPDGDVGRRRPKRT
jgi:hypothetical protein